MLDPLSSGIVAGCTGAAGPFTLSRAAGRPLRGSREAGRRQPGVATRAQDAGQKTELLRPPSRRQQPPPPEEQPPEAADTAFSSLDSQDTGKTGALLNRLQGEERPMHGALVPMECCWVRAAWIALWKGVPQRGGPGTHHAWGWCSSLPQHKAPILLG